MITMPAGTRAATLGERVAFQSALQGSVSVPEALASPFVAPARTSAPLGLRVVNLAEFLREELAPRELILAPWIQTQSLSMIHAWRGVGKTFVALNVGYTVATGGEFLGWKAPGARKVLYIDGEMPAVALKERL